MVSAGGWGIMRPGHPGSGSRSQTRTLADTYAEYIEEYLEYARR